MSEDQIVDAVIKRSVRAVLIAGTAVILTFLQPYFMFVWWKIGLAFGLMSTTRGSNVVAMFGLGFLLALVVIPPEFVQAIWSAVPHK